ncbi:MAG TPA: carboxypeptidase-like regulatory domain-containing protein [Saprospiraceae bacterium]|nr:carboxypeptidase-like regulatory domain-containing protein [Saprospiraceae bacterium]HMP24443.1 carboxypeptidase-like regulatory domain-containing protein [Saprospiraceae bacterium]
MKNLLIACLLMCFYLQIIAQTISGKVVHAITGEALPYVNIGLIGTTHGTVSGLAGAFELFLPETTRPNDSIRFSSIGFAQISMTVGAAINGSPLYLDLQPTVLNLPEITVRPLFTNYKIIGNDKITASNVTNLAISNRANQNLGSEIGRRFKSKKGETIEKMRFYIAQNNFDTVRFRINVYAMRGGRPGQNLMPENRIVEIINRRTGWVEVDLSAYQIQPAVAFVASAEWVYAGGKGNRLSFPITIPSVGATHFYKYGSQNNWKKFAQMSAAIEVTLAW